MLIEIGILISSLGAVLDGGLLSLLLNTCRLAGGECDTLLLQDTPQLFDFCGQPLNRLFQHEFTISACHPPRLASSGREQMGSSAGATALSGSRLRASSSRSSSLMCGEVIPNTSVCLSAVRRARSGTAGPTFPYRRIFAYNEAASSRRCTISFTDANDITHTALVSAASLFEAAALGVAEFRRCGFADVALGVGTTLDVTVQSPSTTHSLRLAKLEAWLNSSGKSPAEQALKVRLKDEIARVR